MLYPKLLRPCGLFLEWDIWISSLANIELTPIFKKKFFSAGAIVYLVANISLAGVDLINHFCY